MNEFKKDEDFARALALQKENVDKKISPILQLYDDNKITLKELAEKLSDAFYDLEKDC